ncbi:MAG: ATP-binding protein [Saprospiraceae bacterium]|nr:ATP-binding protein [Saprospiraceae bacterium]
MSLRFRYFLFMGILHLLMAVGLYYLLKDHKIYFLLCEGLLLISLGISVSLYKKLIRPIELMQTGTNALANKDFTVKYVKTGASEMDRLIEVYNTMIDTLRVEQTRTVEQSYFLEKLIQASPIGMIIMDFDGNIADINPVAAKILSIQLPAKGNPLEHYHHPLIPQIVTLNSGETKLLSVNGYHKFRCQVDMVIHKGFPRKFIILTDLTAELLESEKEAYGKVIRMMAHEVNNSMGAINSILHTVVEYGFSSDDSDPDLKDSLNVAIDRNKSLAKFIDNFADIIRLPKPTMTRHQLNKLLLNASKPWETSARNKNIVFTYKLSKQEVEVDMDASQIERVLSNALKNAMESIGSDGEIIISSQTNPVQFEVIDNGPGISKRIEKKIFTPFYSTKTNGQGIGLMLSREIIENHNGTLRLETEKKSGLTHFTVTL